MKLRTCEFCGTEFSADELQCPLCGKTVSADELLEFEQAAESAVETPYSGTPRDQAPGKHTPAKKKGGARVAKKTKKSGKDGSKYEKAAPGENVYKIPKWMMVVICVILGLAVTLGALFGMYNMGWLSRKSAISSSEATPPTDQQATEQLYTNEEDYTEPAKPAEEEVQTITCTSLSLGSNSFTFDAQEQFANMKVSVEPSDCTEEVVYTSSNEAVATVNANGKIVAVNGGTATITVTCGIKSAECLVTCDFTADEQTTDPATPPKLSSEDMTLFYPGEQAVLLVSDAAEDAVITYTSSDSSVASVTASGTVTAVGSGTATVTVTVDDTTLKCMVRCKLEDSAESTASGTYTISHSDVTMSIQGEYFKLTLKDADGNTVSGVSWVTGDTSVCTVDGSGVVYAAGKGTTTVSTTYGGASYQCIVRCNIG